jgi:hypothetical protein
LCREGEFEVTTLYPNATRILQLADVAIFHPIKISWWGSVREWHTKHPGEFKKKKVSFAPLLKEVI